MIDHRNISDDKHVSRVDRHNNLKQLQAKLDAFIEHENAIMDTSTRQSDFNESQQRLDHFINNIQHQLDSFIAEMPDNSSGKSVVAHDSGTPEGESMVDQMEVFEQSDNREHEVPVALSTVSTTPTSYSSVIATVLIGSSCAIAAVLWFIWPIEQKVPTPPLLANKTIQQPIPAVNASESMQTKTVTEQANTTTEQVDTATERDRATVNKPVPVVKATTERQHIAPHVEKQAQPIEPVRLTVAVRIGNIRNKPDKSGKVLYRLIQGAVVTKINEQHDWYQIRLKNGTVAWAHRSIF